MIKKILIMVTGTVKNASLRQLRTFIAVARHLSFSQAARELHITAPAVTMQIQELEADVGLPLFDRSGKKVTLTTVGEYLLMYARRMMAVMHEAEDVLARLKRLEGGRLRVGLVRTAKHFVPQLLARFRQDHPAAEIILRVENREGLLEALREHQIDLAIMGRPAKDIGARAEAFAMHPHVLIAAPDHPFARRERLSPQALNDVEFIMREPGSGTRAAVEHFFSESQIHPRITMEISSNEAIKQAVIAGLGVSIVSLHTVGMELRYGLLASVEMDSLPILRSWHVVHLQSKTLSPIAEALRYFILEQGERFFADNPVFAAHSGK